MKCIIQLIVILLLIQFKGNAQSVNYTLDLDQPQTHYASVTMQISNWKGGDLNIVMPVWTPGSYLIREFERNVESLKVSNANTESSAVKIRKNCWQIKNVKAGNVKISYKVYAFEFTVRTSFIDVDHASINGASIFMYVEGTEKWPCVINIHPYKEWKVISVALDRVEDSNPWTVKADDYDHLVDAPFEIGNHTVIKFEAAHIPHEIAMVGEGNYNADRLKNDVAKIVEAETAVFGSNPCKRYVFIIHNVNASGGGLEHTNSSTIDVGKWAYADSTYPNAMMLFAHEYFHLWNVKRLRPFALGPFDYNKENPTNMLYVAEGFTSFYEKLITERCGFTNEDKYFSDLAGVFNYVDNSKADSIQSVTEASYDAWIKYYRPYENSTNNSLSYYTKGNAIAALINLEILNDTKGEKCLDDFMQMMYKEYFLKLNRGYTDKEFIDGVSKICGKNMNSFFEKDVYGVEQLPYKDFLYYGGLDLNNDNEKSMNAWFGANTSSTSGKLTVTSVERNSPAWNDGINVNDELIAIDQYRLTDDISKFIAKKKPGDEVVITVSRGGYIKLVDVTLTRSYAYKYKIRKADTISEEQKQHYSKWLQLK